MFLELSKLFNFLLVSPISWIILLLVAFFVAYHHKHRYLWRLSLITAVTVFLTFTNVPLVRQVKYCMTKGYTTTGNPIQNRTYRVAIVMGGFGIMNEGTGQLCYENGLADRLWEAVRLWRNGMVERILITGDATSIIRQDGSSATELFLDYMEQLGVKREVFILEQYAANTHQNAVNCSKILEAIGISDKDCLLITSATHMKRSLGCFAKINWKPDFMAVGMPQEPTILNHRAFYPDWKAAFEWQEIFNEWIGICAYSLMGYM